MRTCVNFMYNKNIRVSIVQRTPGEGTDSFSVLLTFRMKADILNLRYCEKCIDKKVMWVLYKWYPYVLKKIWNAFHNMEYQNY